MFTNNEELMAKTHFSAISFGTRTWTSVSLKKIASAFGAHVHQAHDEKELREAFHIMQCLPDKCTKSKKQAIDGTCTTCPAF